MKKVPAQPARSPGTSPDKIAAKTSGINVATYQKLFSWNKWLAILHAAQAIIILIIGATKTFPVTSSYLTTNTLASETAGSPVLATATWYLFDVNLGCLVATFFLMSAAAHALIATVYRKRYEADLEQGINKVRWFEYGLSASTMLVAIAVLSGITDLALLLCIFALSFIMNMMGLAMELYNQGNTRTRSANTKWFTYTIGCLAGAMPWLVIGLYLLGSALWGSGNIPAFVYWIYGSMFLAFNCFAINMYLQYTGRGKWVDYLYGERVYMLLSLIAKTLLAWQVFAGALRP